MTSLFAGLPRLYWLLWTGTLINRLGGFVVPFLSLYLTGRRGLSVSQAALMVSLFGAGSFAAQLVGGDLADRLGRRPVMLISFFATPVAMVALGLAAPVAVIATCILLVGFFTDLYRPAVNAAIADLVSPEARPRAYGYNYWAVNVGAAVAPVVAGLLAERAYLALFVGDAVTTLAFGIIVLVGLRETRPAAAVATAGLSVAASVRDRLAVVRRDPVLLAFAALSLGIGLIYLQGFVTMPLAMQARGLGPDAYGLAIGANGLLIVLISVPAAGMVGRWPRFAAMAIAAALVGLGFGATALATTLPLVITCVVVWTLGEIVMSIAAPAIVADLAPVPLRGLYQGVYGSSFGLAAMAGPTLGGWVLQSRGAGALWTACLALGLLVCGAFIALGGPARRRMARVGGGV